MSKLLHYGVLVVVGMYFTFMGLAEASGFLVPVTIAVLLAMVINPLVHRLQGWGIGKGLSVFLSDLVLLIFIVVVILLFSSQVDEFTGDLPGLKEKVIEKSRYLRNFISDKFGVKIDISDERVTKLSGSLFSSALKGAKSVTGFLGTTLMVLVYVFFFQYYKHQFRNFVLKLVSRDDQENVEKIIDQSAVIAQNYLVGKFTLILILAIAYGIGFSIVGIKYALFMAIIVALFSLLPYIGNFVGGGLVVMVIILTGGGLNQIIGVAIVFATAQFVESYILEPYIVGQKVDLSPVFTIVAVVLGGAVWGIAGMVIAIPVLGIFKVIFDNVPALQPFGYLVGEEDKNGESGLKKAMIRLKKKITGK